MTGEQIHVLFVGLDANTEARVTTALEDNHGSIETMAVSGVAEAMGHFDSHSIECVVSSDSLADGTGIELLRSIRESSPSLPYILVAETLSDELIRQAITANVTTYLPHHTEEAWISLLADRISAAVTQYRTAESAGELERINTVIRQLNRALVHASSTDEIYQQVCEILSQSEPYVFAWIGTYDEETGVVTPRAAAGIEEGYLADITITTGEEPTAAGPTGRAVSSREIQVMQNIVEDPAYEPWREEALERGYRSSAAIPLNHDDTFQGILNVYANRVEAFDQAERDLLTEVGGDIALALHNIQVSDQVSNLTETLRTIREVDERLVRANDRGETIDDIVTILSEHPSFNHISLALVNDDHIQYASKAGTPIPDEQIQEIHADAYIDEVLDREFLQIADVTKPPYKQYFGELRSHGAVAFALRHQTTEYGILTIHFRPEKTPTEGEIDLLREVGQDIAHALHRLQLSEDLRTEKQRYQTVVENIHDGLIIVRDGVIQYANSEVSAITGYSTEEVTGKQLDMLVSEDDQVIVMKRYRERIEGNEPRETYEIELISKDGQTVPVEVSVGLFEYEGEPATIAAVRDISERIDRTRQLRVLDRVLRHNLHNTMTIIQGFAQTIHDETDRSDVAADAEKIVTESQKLVETVDKEREIVEIISQPVTHTDVDLGSVIEQVATIVREEYPDSDIALDLPSGAIAIGTPKLPRALEELLTNAIIHNDQETPEVSIDVELQAETVQIRIVDTGPGIPDEEVHVLTGEREVEPLFHGSGLGLWLVNWIIRRSDGQLIFEANEPRGSIVIIELTRAA